MYNITITFDIQTNYKRAEHNSHILVSLNDQIMMDLKVSTRSRDYALLCCKIVINIKPLNECQTQELYFTFI